MESEKNSFDIAGLELVKKKYYNAGKVAELFAAMQAQCDSLTRENEELRAQLDSISAQKTQISDTLMSAQSIARQMIEDAKLQAEETARLAQTQAEETVKSAEKKAELILSGAKSKKESSEAEVNQVQEYALRCVEACVEKLRQQHMESIETINAQWQSFLSGLILPEDRMSDAAEPETQAAPGAEEKPVDWMAIANMEMPEYDVQYDDIDADTFFSGSFFNEHSGADLFAQLKNMMDSIEHDAE